MAYSRVCGRIIGYQFGATQVFVRYDLGQVTTIEGQYVDGVILTHGAPGARQHIIHLLLVLPRLISPVILLICARVQPQEL